MCDLDLRFWILDLRLDFRFQMYDFRFSNWEFGFSIESQISALQMGKKLPILLIIGQLLVSFKSSFVFLFWLCLYLKTFAK